MLPKQTTVMRKGSINSAVPVLGSIPRLYVPEEFLLHRLWDQRMRIDRVVRSSLQVGPQDIHNKTATDERDARTFPTDLSTALMDMRSPTP